MTASPMSLSTDSVLDDHLRQFRVEAIEGRDHFAGWQGLRQRG